MRDVERMEVGTLPGVQLGLPLVVRPRGDRRPEALAAWLEANADGVAERLRRHGALLFRGFAVDRAEDFEVVARAVAPDLKDEYLGTSPRNALTRYVFTASELPGHYPIPQHCEMSFVADPPRRLFFCALRPNDGEGGETPLCDFRRVHAELDPEVRRRFEEGGLRIVRNYAGPSGGGRLDPWKLKRWDEMFGTTDRAEVERKCREQGFELTWTGKDGLRLVSEQPAVRTHPETGEPVWFNHVQVFHVGSAEAEYRRIHGLRPGPRTWGLWQFVRAATEAQRRLRPADAHALHTTYRDGREIPAADLEHLRDVIWRNLVVYRWERGDVVAIDNRAVSHGRLPYRGPRTVAVAWA
jgi:alpha-ketoglutarate-dependent taurine dioxygenase